jgi:hypothetical protein
MPFGGGEELCLLGQKILFRHHRSYVWCIPQDWNEADAYAKAGAVSPLYHNHNC